MKLAQKSFYYVALVQALIATLASLYLSEILHWTPCVLCWYQRICMYPLIIILSVGILRKDKGLPFYVLPISILGACIAFYHYLLQRGIISASLAPCQAGVSCTVKYTMWFGFITIPFLSLVAFVIITLCMMLAKRYNK